MPVNKVVFGAVAIMDISDSTVTEDTLGEGATAYDKAGNKITGKMKAGVELPALTTPGAAADLRSGKQLIDGDGNVVDGSMPDVEVPTAELALLNSRGTIYANVQQSAGYTPGGTTTTQLDLPVQEGKTVTPTKSKQVAVSAGKWCTESVEVDAIPEEYIVPSGTKSITANGTHDVKSYASVNVAVPTEDLNTVLTEQEALITELETALEGKAAGGGPEICTGTIQQTSYHGYDAVVYYTNADFESETLILDGSKTTYTISVPKGAVMVVCDGFSYNRVGIDQILDAGGVEVFFVTGDFSMICDG